MNLLEEIVLSAGQASQFQLVAQDYPKPSGIDPLGLRQVNFDLMDQVFPGLNNVARHIRPFVVVSWAWRRAIQVAERSGVDLLKADLLHDFVDRIDVIYVWSQFMLDDQTDLPGGQVLGPLLQATSWNFGGPEWKKRRDDRRLSTALMSPINYGPGLKALEWLSQHSRYPQILVPSPRIGPALDAFEAELGDIVNHPAFNTFGELAISASDVSGWGKVWSLDTPTLEEKNIAAELVFGATAPTKRRNAGILLRNVVKKLASSETNAVREEMAQTEALSDEFYSTSTAWRQLQNRQLFRICLEALLYWLIKELQYGSRTTDSLTNSFISQMPGRLALKNTEAWLDHASASLSNPVPIIERVVEALENESSTNLAQAIVDGIFFSVCKEPLHQQVAQSSDRLPISRAKREIEAFADRPTAEFVSHLLEAWVLSQHVYWSVGRGLADARADGKRILRLKVVLEEAGWTLTPSASLRSKPQPTGDRLRTAISLAEECDWFS